MANDIASLGLRIDSSEVERGSEALDKLAQSGARAEQATRKFEESADKAKESVKSEKDEIARLLGQIDPTTKAFERLDQQERKLYQLRASNKLDLDTYTQYRQKIDEGREALARANDGLTRTGNTAKQTAAAMRNVPAQFTDIVVSLQGGQQPLTVLLQQGGQLKDMFGGIGPAARALGGYVAGLVNPFTVAAAAAGTLALAYYKGSSESEDFNKALILTGGYAGVTAGQLGDLSKELDGLSGVTQSSAAAALIQVAESGKFTGEQIKLVATAAEQMRVATGKSVEDTVAEFAKLRKDPVSAILDLNDQYHFLTESQFKQIQSLKDQGKEQEAVSEAFRIYAGVIGERTPQIAENLGTIERAWKLLKEAESETVDGALAIGRAAPDTQVIDELTKRIAYLKSTIGTGFEPFADTPGEIAKLQAQLDKLTASQKTAAASVKKTIDSGDARDRSKAETDWDRIRVSNLNKQARLEQDIVQIRKVGLAAGKSQAEIDKEVAAARAKYNEGLAKPRTRAYQDDAATRMLASIKQQEAGLRAQLSTSEKLTGARRELAQFEQQIADLRGKDQLTAEQKSLLANADRIRSELQIKATLEDQNAAREQLNRLTERSAQIQESAARSLQSQQEQYDRQLQGAGLGSQARERVEAQRSIYREYQRYQDQLTKATPKDLLGSEQYKQASRDIQDSLDQAIKANQNYYDQLDQQNQDWRNGASDAFNDYIDNAKNVSAQTRDLFSSAFSGAEDALAKFVTTGKLSFKDLANSIIEDLARIAIRQAATGLFSSALGAATSYFGGGGGAATTFATASSTTTGMTFGGGRASGGSVTPNTFYQVNENGPELLSQGGKTYLMTGAQGGEITPLGSGSQSMTQGSAGSMVKVDIHIASDGTTDVSTNQSGLQQFGSELGTFVEQKYRQLIARSMKPGGEVWSAMNGRA